ncbi:MAG: hypothetical protein DRH51_06125 [Candidatus Coatesbacteria bacterium]|nr:MAG: hypothetical protein DRH51_06125 [Candidatus Coatesbacteria bacterium]HEC80056.1 hypothetical protein [Bacillota bacterium]
MRDIIMKREEIRNRIILFMYENSVKIVPFPFIHRDEIATGVSDVMSSMKDGESELDFAIEYLCDKGLLVRERRRSNGLPYDNVAITSEGVDLAEKILKEEDG